MRIGIDARPLSRSYLGGIGTYLYQILSNADGCCLSDVEIYLYSNQEIRFKPQISHVKIVEKVSAGKPSVLWLRYRVPKLIVEDEIDVFWGPNHVLPLRFGGVKQVITIHDLALLINGKWGNSIVDTLVQKFLTSRSARSADAILADSRSTRNDLMNLLEINSSKIRCVYCGVSDPDWHESDSAEGFLQKRRINGRYFLYYGDLNLRKNVDTIIAAFDLFCSRADGSVRLVLAGGNRQEKYDQFLSGVSAQCRERIICPGYISEEQKATLLNESIALVFPSRYEGFGIPVVEAMRCNTLVITSNCSSLPEVAGDSAYYLKNVDDPNELAALMDMVSRVQDVERALRITQGNEYSQRFSWKRCAQETFELLCEIGENR